MIGDKTGRRSGHLAVALVVVLSLPCVLLAEEDEAADTCSSVVVDGGEEHVWKGEPISLSLKDADLVEVLRSFAELADVNIIVDPRVKGTVTLELEEVPWDQALDVILKTHGLAVDTGGQRLWSLRPRPKGPPRQSQASE